MPKLTLYNVWFPDTKPPSILIAGDREIHSLFIEDFPDYEVSLSTWPPGKNQMRFDYGFYVNKATQNDKKKFEAWLETYMEIQPILLESPSLDEGYALTYHTGRIHGLVRKAKPYGTETATLASKIAALELVDVLVNHLSHLPKPDYVVAIPYLNKLFDLPEFLTVNLAEKTKLLNGSKFVMQVEEKQFSQKDLETPEEKRANIKGKFALVEGHPFNGKVITIIDDIYQSGVTIEELALTLKNGGAKRVQALILTKTFN